MDATEFRACRVRAGLSVRKAAEELSVSASTIERWQTGAARIPADAADTIRALAGDAPLAPIVARALGHLYAVLERILGDDTPGNMPTLMTSSPAAAVAILMRLGREQHIAAYQAAEAKITAIMADIPDYPDRLTGNAEGAFWLGYYNHKAKDH